MIRFPLVVAWVALSTATPVAAQQRLSSSPTYEQVRAQVMAEFKNAVAACVTKVRQEVHFSKFDAYVDGHTYGQIHTFGNQEELFRFNNCMTETGLALDPE